MVVKKQAMKWVIGIVVLLLLSQKAPEIIEEDEFEPITTTSTGDTPVTITFHVTSGKQALVEGQDVPSASGYFTISVQNNKAGGIDISNLDFISQTDTCPSDGCTVCETGATDEFQDADMLLDATTDPGRPTPGDGGYWEDQATLANGATYPSSGATQTGTFDLECYVNDPGVTTFEFTFDHDYTDEQGNAQTNQQFSVNIPIDIFSNTCSDTTPLGNCNSAGELCEYVQDVGPQLTADRACCFSQGGSWEDPNCVFSCGAIPFGGCDTTPTPGTPKANTWCNPATGQMEENCGECLCYDWHGNPSQGCSGLTCTYYDYSGNVVTNLGGTGTGPTTFCQTCTGWSSAETCGEDNCQNVITCDSSQVCEYRSCTPASCTDPFGGAMTLERCVEDYGECCTPGEECDATWSDVGCGIGSCGATEMNQTRTCTDPDAACPTGQCVPNHPTCA